VNNFYVYEHARADTSRPFYIGKGCGDRAKSKQGRNPYWKNVVAKAGGYSIRVVASGLDEELALLAEIEAIAAYRARGFVLTNATDGGEGMSGYIHSPESRRKISESQTGLKRPNVSLALAGVPKSDVHRAHLAKAKLGSKASVETRAKMSLMRKGRPSSMLGRKHREESKQKISAAQMGSKNHFSGRQHSSEVVESARLRNLGKKLSDETKERMSIARTGDKNPRFGVVVSDDQKARQIAALKARPRVTCPHCAMSMDEANAKRWHMNNCKER
jgi:hypothetical protein